MPSSFSSSADLSRHTVIKSERPDTYDTRRGVSLSVPGSVSSVSSSSTFHTAPSYISRAAYLSHGPSTAHNSRGKRPTTSASSRSTSGGWSHKRSQDSTFGGSSSRSLAPGLALKKVKVDPYDPEGVHQPSDDYILLEEKKDAEVTGTWTSIDPDDDSRSYDKHWNAASSRNCSHASSGSTTPTPSGHRFRPGSSRSSMASVTVKVEEEDQVTVKAEEEDERPSPLSVLESWVENSDMEAQQEQETPSVPEAIDELYENPEIEVDADIRAKFKPRSAFELRNAQIMPQRLSAPRLKVVIGDKVVKTMEPKGDDRGQFQDRSGNYIGPDRGAMKKHLVEDRKALIELRDAEMVRKMEEKWFWDSLGPWSSSVRGSISSTNLDRPEIMEALGAFEFSHVPEVYKRRATVADIAAWTSRMRLDSASSRAASDFRTADSDNASFYSMNSAGLDDDGLSINTRVAGASEFRASAIGSRTASYVHSLGASGRTTPCSSSVTSFLRSLVVLAPVADVELDSEVEVQDADAETCAKARMLCSTRGRVVRISLHDLVLFSPCSVMSRIFGGTVQEVQFFPAERVALVVFLFPIDAEHFIRHAERVRKYDAQEYRRLQLDAEWYRGEERLAIVPIQTGIFRSVLALEATRILQLSGISSSIKREELADQLKNALQKILANVAVIKEPRAHVREQYGNSAILEFVSIKDAIECFRRFRRREVPSFQKSDVSWLKDPCDRAPMQCLLCNCRECVG